MTEAYSAMNPCYRKYKATEGAESDKTSEQTVRNDLGGCVRKYPNGVAKCLSADTSKNILTLALITWIIYCALSNYVELGCPFRLPMVGRVHEDLGILTTILVVLYIPLFHVVALGLEKLLLKAKIGEATGLFLQLSNLIAVLTCPVIWIRLHVSTNFGFRTLITAFYVYTFLKLVSYTVQNRKYRLGMRKTDITKSSMSTLNETTYPNNLVISNSMYFAYLPNYVYKLNYAKKKKVDWTAILKQLMIVVVGTEMNLNMFDLIFIPRLKNYHVEAGVATFTNINEMLDNFRSALEIVVPLTLIVLISVHSFLYTWLRISGELHRYADTDICLDWWNADSIKNYWQRWNLPIHAWLSRYVFKPVFEVTRSKFLGVCAAFFVSGLIHDYAVYTGTGVLSCWCAATMVLQAPLIVISDKVRDTFGRKYSNFMVVLMWPFTILGIVTYVFKKNQS